MLLIRGLAACPSDDRPSAVVIGNVDGVHVGHQALIERAAVCARQSDARLTVLTFEPYPREFLVPTQAPARLMRLREKYEAIKALGVECLLVARFDGALQALSPQAFVDEVLVRRLKARAVVIGEGFRFGAKQSGHVEHLALAGQASGFEVHVMPSVLLGGERVSSTRIRAALVAGDFALTTRLLGRAFALSGRVIGGERLGRTLGYPTANMRLYRQKLPLGGIFAVRVQGVAGRPNAPGVASLGTRPTVGGGLEPLLEVHLFDYSGDLYGQRLHVEFVAKLREEAKFPTLDAMIEQMHVDAARARELLNLVAA